MASLFQDPYTVLKVSRDADLHEIRRAYRRAVVKYHPDTCRCEPKLAERRFRELTAAYQRLARRFDAHRRSRRRAADARRPDEMIPDFRWEFVSEEQLGEVIATAWRNRKGTVRRLVYPVVHEPLVFFLGCMVGMTVACVSVWVFVGTVFADRYREEIRSWEIALLMAAGLGVYVIITLLATWLLIASRRVVWMVFRSSSFWRRSLPGPSTAHHPRQ